MERIAQGWKVSTVVGAMLVVLAQTKPEEALSNIAAWAKLASIDQLPAFLSEPAADNAATALGFFIAILSAIMWLREVRKVRHRPVVSETIPHAMSQKVSPSAVDGDTAVREMVRQPDPALVGRVQKMEEKLDAQAKKPVLQRQLEIVQETLVRQSPPSLGRMKMFAQVEADVLRQLERLRPSSIAEFEKLKSELNSKIFADAKYYVLTPSDGGRFRDGDEKRLWHTQEQTLTSLRDFINSEISKLGT